jgi:hypothetical protein
VLVSAGRRKVDEDTSETKYTQALALYKQMLAIRPRVLGPDHPKVIQSLGELLSTTQLWVNLPGCRGLADHGSLFAATPLAVARRRTMRFGTNRTAQVAN